MYVLALITYLKPLAEILPHLGSHRAYLRSLEADGILLASGPFEPRTGGAVLLRLPDDTSGAALNKIWEADPFSRLGLASYELRQWNPAIGLERLDTM